MCQGLQGEADVQGEGVISSHEKERISLTMEQWKAMLKERMRQQAEMLSNRVTTRPEIQEQIKQAAEAKRVRKAARMAKMLEGGR